MQPHTFDRVAPHTYQCQSCGRLTRVEGPDEAPSLCDGCSEIERMDTVRVDPLSPSELEPPPE